MSIRVTPKITEKTLAEVEENNIYTFEVYSTALKINKVNVKRYVESNYDVKVDSVNILNRLGKPKRYGKNRVGYRTPTVKVAYVKVLDGESIPEFNIEEGNEK